MISKKLLRQLDVIDWDFPVSQQGGTKTPHWYPGTFPAQLPATFIQALTKPGDIIFDPYGGAGTTAAEALRLGRRAWLADVNPIGILGNYPLSGLLLLKIASKQKFELFFQYIDCLIGNDKNAPAFDFAASDIKALNIDSFVEKHMRPLPGTLLNQIRLREEINWKSLEKWLHRSTLKELKNFYNSTCNNESLFIRLFCESMISANLRALSSQNKSWGHIADNVYPKELVYKSVNSQFQIWLTRLKTNLTKATITKKKLTGICYWASIHDWTSEKSIKVTPRTSADLIITSPPYGDAIDYIYAQKLSLYFLGYTEDEITLLCNQEIGARRRRTKPNSRKIWADQLTEAAITQSQFLDKGLFVTILPHKNHGREMGLKSMTNGLKENGWNKVFEVDRSIDQKKTRQSWTSIKQETICIYSREK